MSFSLFRVPKKAAMTALHGLLVGSSCSLLLVLAEERRRRIKWAQTMLENAERIRSCKQYHGSRGSNQESADLELWGDFVSKPDSPFRRHTARRMRTEYKDWDSKNAFEAVFVSKKELKSEVTEEHTPSATEESQHSVAEPGADESSDPAVDPPTQRPSQAQSEVTTPNTLGMLETKLQTAPKTKPRVDAWSQMRDERRLLQPIPQLLTPDMFRSMLQPTEPLLAPVPETGAVSKKPDVDVQANLKRIRHTPAVDLQNAVTIFVQTAQAPNLSTEDKAMLAHEGASLCVRCQRAEHLDSAALVLASVLRYCRASEETYFACNPLPVVDHVIQTAEATTEALRYRPNLNRRQQIWAAKSIERILELLLFRPTGDSVMSQRRRKDWLFLAERTIDLAFETADCTYKQAQRVFRFIVLELRADPDGRVAAQYFQRLAKRQRYSGIVNTFCLLKTSFKTFTANNWFDVGNIAADAAVLYGSASKILQTMIDFHPNLSPKFTTTLPLRTTWVTSLLYGHWKQEQNFEGTLALFHDQFEVAGVLNQVVHVDGPYRVMIQIATEAEQWAVVGDLFAQMQTVCPHAVKEARIQSLMSRRQAIMGDWDGVFENFQNIEIKIGMEYAFGPILMEFSKTHTVQETEDFIKLYAETFKMPISPYMANFMAGLHGRVGEVQPLLDWLAYCVKKGSKVDANYSKAILSNCRRHWGFDLEGLKRIYRTLKALSPDFVDQWTETSMISNVLRSVLRRRQRKKTTRLKAHAAVSDASSFQILKGKFQRLKTNFKRTVSIANPHELRIDMKHALASKKYSRVLLLLEAAARRSMKVDGGHLQLAVRATVMRDGGIKNALHMAIRYQAQGMDVSRAAVSIFVAQMRRIADVHGYGDMFALETELQRLVALFDQNKVPLDASALLRAAHMLFEARHYHGAIKLALTALHRRSSPYPDDPVACQVLLLAFAATANYRGIKWTVVGAVQSNYYHKLVVYKALKKADSILGNLTQSADVIEARRIIYNALSLVRESRRIMEKERLLLEQGALQIMSEAALEAVDTEAQSDKAARSRQEILAAMEASAARTAAMMAQWRAEEGEYTEPAGENKEQQEQERAQADLMAMLIEAHKYEPFIEGSF